MRERFQEKELLKEREREKTNFLQTNNNLKISTENKQQILQEYSGRKRHAFYEWP